MAHPIGFYHFYSDSYLNLLEWCDIISFLGVVLKGEYLLCDNMLILNLYECAYLDFINC